MEEQEQDQDYEVRIDATKGQIQRFKKSILWQDIQREFSLWLKGFEVEHDGIVDEAAGNNPSTASVLLHMGDLNGRKKSILYMLGILDMFLDTLEAKDDSKHEQDV